MKSVSIIQHTPGTLGEPDTLKEIARHFQIAWATAVAQIEENTFIESDAEGNLIVLHQNVHGVTPEDRRRLEVTSEMCLGEQVNRIKSVNVDAAPGAVVMPRAFLATVCLLPSIPFHPLATLLHNYNPPFFSSGLPLPNSFITPDPQ